MSLLSANIPKVKRLPPLGVKIPAKEERPVEPVTAPLRPSDEEVGYNTILARNPSLEALVEALDLVSCKTGERIKRVAVPEDYKPQPEARGNSRLIALAEEILQRETGYLREDLIALIAERTKVSQERAERGFNLMLQAGAVEEDISQGLYYLPGSTPF